jgi:hypothetical protein
MHKKTQVISLLAVLAFIVAWSVFLLFVSPEGIVEAIGVRQGYALLFLVAVLGGVSTLTSSSFYAILITLAAGGLNPLLLGVFGGTGLAISDSIYFFIGRRARDVIERGYIDAWADRLASWLNKKPTWFVPAATYFLTGFTPAPSDLIMLSLAYRTGASCCRYFSGA